MIKRIASFISAMFLVIIILPSMNVSAEMLTGYPAESGLIDELGLYSNDTTTFEQLDSLIKKKGDELGLNLIVFLAGKHRSEEDTIIFADDSYDEIFGEDTDGVFYYLDLSGYSPATDRISTSGKAVFYYDDSTDEIFSKLDYYLPASGSEIIPDDIANAVVEYTNCLSRYADSDPSVFDVHYDEFKDTYAYFKHGQYVVSDHKPLVVYFRPFCKSLLASFIISLIIYLITKSRYKFKGTVDPKIYVANNQTKFTEKQDIFIRKDTSRTRISSESSGGGGGGGSHRSSGGSHHSHSGHHGGGSHHR